MYSLADIVTSFLHPAGSLITLLNDGADGKAGLVMSALAGAAAALAVALLLILYLRTGYRSIRDLIKHGFAAILALALLTFVAYDMRHAAFAYLGINPSKPMVEFEIRLPQAALPTMSDSQVELHTDRNQTLAQVEGVEDGSDGRSVLRGIVAIDRRTTDRVVVLNLAGRAQCEFRLRLAAKPSRTTQFGPWHLADHVASPPASGPAEIEPRDGFAIRYRVF
jgi:hypothetical protein